MKRFAIFHELQDDLLLGWMISVANRAIPVNLEFDRRRRFEEVSMPFVFRTARALSGLGSLACATVLAAAFVALSIASQTAAAAEATPSETSIEQRIQALVPSLEEYISANMKSFDVPGLAIGIVAGDKLVYAKGFGVRTKGGAAAVDTQTLFQIGSAIGDSDGLGRSGRQGNRIGL